MKTKYLLFLLLFSSFVSAQDLYDANWLMDRAYFLNVRSEIKTTPLFKMPQLALGRATISNKQGHVKYYTNGCKIWDAKHKIVPNSSNLNPGERDDERCTKGGLGYSDSQDMFFLPSSVDSNLYFLFHVATKDAPTNGFHKDKLYYSEVVGTPNGESYVRKKSVLILQDTFGGGGLSATKHANGKDWWIVKSLCKKTGFVICHFADSIVETRIQNIGIKRSVNHKPGQGVFSPDGSKYAWADPVFGLLLFDFDRCAGVFSNPIRVFLPNMKDNACSGVAFSPNSQLLYVTINAGVYQVVLATMESELVALYDGFVGEDAPTGFYLSALAPNGKIYIHPAASNRYLHTIHTPNNRGKACDLRQHDFKLPMTNYTFLENTRNYRLGVLKGSDCDPALLAISEQMRFELYPNPTFNEVKVRADFRLPRAAHIRLFDVQGRLLQEFSIEKGTDSFKFSVENYPAAMYFLQIKSNGYQQQTIKFVKMNQ